MEEAALELSTTSRLHLQEAAACCPETSTAGGGPGALAVKVGLLEQEIERFSEGLQGLVGEAEGVIGGLFERIMILHTRTSRIEGMLGVKPWEDEGGEGSSPGSPRASGASAGCPEGFDGSPRRRTCRRGHPLCRDEDGGDGPPRVCGFCRRSRPSAHLCSQGCYFHACAECVEDEPAEGAGDGAGEGEGEGCAVPEAAPCGLDHHGPAYGGEPEEPACGSWPAGPPAASPPASRGASQMGSRCGSRPGSCAASVDGGGACTAAVVGHREPETPSTDVPAEEEQGWPEKVAFERTPHLPPRSGTAGSAEGDSEAGGPAEHGWHGATPAPRGAEGGNLPVKVRLGHLEAELKALEKRLAGAGGHGCGAAPPREQLEEVVGLLLQEESLRLQELFRRELGRVAAEGAELVTACEAALREECQDAASQAGKALRGEVFSRVEDSGQRLRAELQGVAEQASASTAALREECHSLGTRVTSLEGELPRGRARPPRPSSASTLRLGGDARAESPAHGAAGDPATVDGLVQGLAALSRALGLLPDGEVLGEGADGWAAVGRRLDRAWAARVKDFWQVGLPARPHLFDLLRVNSGATAAAPVGAGTALATVLPDRREGARLATRLAAAVAFSHGKSGDLAKLEEEEAGTPKLPSKFRRSSSLTSTSASGPVQADVRSTRLKHGSKDALPAQEAAAEPQEAASQLDG